MICYDILVLLANPQKGFSPVKAQDGCIASEKDSILIIWQYDFEQLLNKDSAVSSKVLHLVYERETQDDMADPPTLQEVMEAADKQKNGKAVGLDGIPVEVWKYGGDSLLCRLHAIITESHLVYLAHTSRVERL